DDRLAAGSELVEQLIDLLLGPDVDPSGRLIEDQDIAVLQEPATDPDLLLIDARQDLSELGDIGCLDAQLATLFHNRMVRGAIADEPGLLKAVQQSRQLHVPLDGMIEQQTQLFAVLGQVPDAVASGVGRTAERDPATAIAHGSGLPWMGTDQCPSSLGPTSP